MNEPLKVGKYEILLNEITSKFEVRLAGDNFVEYSSSSGWEANEYAKWNSKGNKRGIELHRAVFDLEGRILQHLKSLGDNGFEGSTMLDGVERIKEIIGAG